MSGDDSMSSSATPATLDEARRRFAGDDAHFWTLARIYHVKAPGNMVATELPALLSEATYVGTSSPRCLWCDIEWSWTANTETCTATISAAWNRR